MKDALGHGSNAHGEGIAKLGKYSVANDVFDAHGGEVYGAVYAHHAETGQTVGRLSYGAMNKGAGKEVNIKMIEVAPEHQHRGLASQMLDKLQEEFTRDGRTPSLHWGGMTPDGVALRKSYYRAKAKK